MATASAANDALSNWYHLFDGVQASPKDFYAAVEAAIQKRQVPDTSTSRVDWKEGGILSASREYLRVSRGRTVFDICAAPFGNGFFVSWWLAQTESPHGPLALFILIVVLFLGIGISFREFGFFSGLFFIVFGFPILFWLLVKVMSEQQEGWDDALVAMPYLGPIYKRLFRPDTYYKTDTALMFQESIRRAVNEVADQLTADKGLQPLTELERKPTLRVFGPKGIGL